MHSCVLISRFAYKTKRKRGENDILISRFAYITLFTDSVFVFA